MKTGTVTVIIVNWNSGETLRKCLTCLQSQTHMADRILVIDNGSSDDSMKCLAEFPGVEGRHLGKNTGFAAANNTAIGMSETDYVALLNPDAFPEPGWLQALLEVAQTEADAASFGSRQMAEGLPKRVDGLGDEYHLSGLAWRRGYGRKLLDSDLAAREIFSPCAAAALYRRIPLLEAGGFDEDYFCYMEDVDLGFRLRLAGHKSIYVPDAVVHHVGSASTGGQHSNFSVYYGHRNLVLTYIKNMPGILFWLFLPLHITMNAVSIIFFVILGKGKIILRAKRDAILAIPVFWRKRNGIQKKYYSSVVDIWAILNKSLYPLRK